MLGILPRGTVPLLTQGQGVVVLPFCLSYSRPYITQQIHGFVGETLSVSKTVLRIQPGRYLLTAWITVKRKKNHSDAQALVQKRITTALSIDSSTIVNTGAFDGTGSILFEFTATETTLIGIHRVVFYEIQLQFDTGEIATFEGGNLILVSR